MFFQNGYFFTIFCTKYCLEYFSNWYLMNLKHDVLCKQKKGLEYFSFQFWKNEEFNDVLYKLCKQFPYKYFCLSEHVPI